MKYIICLIAITLFLGGCSTTSKKGNSNKVSKIQKINSLDEGLEEISSKLIKISTDTSLKIAVFDFKSSDEKETNTGNMISDALTEKLFVIQNLEIIEREELDKVVSEQQLNNAGMTGDADVSGVKIEGIDGFITGTITTMGNVYQINARFVSAETGKVISVASTRVNKDFAKESQQNIRANSTDNSDSPKGEVVFVARNNIRRNIIRNTTKTTIIIQNDTEKRNTQNILKETDDIIINVSKTERNRPKFKNGIAEQRSAKQLFRAGLFQESAASSLAARKLIMEIK